MDKNRRFVLLACLLGSGCGTFVVDYIPPQMSGIDARVGSAVVNELRLPDLSITHTRLEGQVPGNATLALIFSEAVKLPSAIEHISVKDAQGAPIGLHASARDSEIYLRPTPGPWTPGQNHILEVRQGIEDTTGNKMPITYVIGFYTQP